VSEGIPAQTKVLDRSATRGNTRHVLIAIASYAKPDGTGAWPSLEAIRSRAGVTSVRTVSRQIKRLVELGELEVAYKAGPRGCNLYTVLCCAPDMDTQKSTSTSDLDSQVSTSTEPRDPTWTSEPGDLDTPAPSRGHPGVPRTGEQEKENRTASASPPAAESGGSAEEEAQHLAEQVKGTFADASPRAAQLAADFYAEQLRSGRDDWTAVYREAQEVAAEADRCHECRAPLAADEAGDMRCLNGHASLELVA
jgi:hypothetical protein